MNKTKLWKIAMPALLASALVFETMPGSVREYTAAESGITTVSANFFTVQSQHPAVMCLPLAGTLTMAVLILALVAAFSKKNGHRLDAGAQGTHRRGKGGGRPPSGLILDIKSLERRSNYGIFSGIY